MTDSPTAAADDASLFYPKAAPQTSQAAALPEETSGADATGADDKALFYPGHAPKTDASPTDATAPTAQVQEYNLSPPEGVSIDANLLTAATPVLRDLGLSNDQASKLVPLANVVQERYAADLDSYHKELRTGWAQQSRADPVIGGANWDETKRIAVEALTIGGAGPGSDVRKLLNETGLGDHPAFIRLFRNIGLRLTERGA